ncbi:hypothetical protein [Pandoraea apista]|uniref:hypothetical protein n=1 Tax=Pandoraea apista TaxID=93218 RepID=UPI0012E170D2|nr:hypothetical protein [Pandoraea apista]
MKVIGLLNEKNGFHCGKPFLNLVANQGDSGLFVNPLINQQLAILAGGVANEKVTPQVSHVRPQSASSDLALAIGVV